jgi:NADH-quinone oxidoreductase subunit C
MAIIKVWIDEGCIVCNACEAECAPVFHVTDDTCVINGAVREDGKTTENRAEKGALKAEFRKDLETQIVAAATGCPVNVIQYEQVANPVEAAPAAPEPKPAEPAPAPKVEAPVAAAPKVEAPAVAPKVEAPAAAAPKVEAPAPAKAEPVAAEPAPAAPGPYVYDLSAAPNRQVVLPKTVPVPSLRTYLEEQAAAVAAEEAKWQKTLADFETAKAKALAEEKDPPKAPVRPAAKVDSNDMKFPAPVEATDPDLLHLKALLGDKIEEIFQQAGELTCQVSRDAILLALELCKEDLDLHYEMLADETATHYPAAQGFAFSVVYHLTSLRRQKRLRLRILIPEGFEPESAVPVYPTANWLEREIWDMLGIRFKNHPDMTRILCPEDWEAHPLRKEYPTVGLGQRDIDFREDRSGVLMRIAMEKAGNMGININPPRAE